jgi:hypothetical protein
MARVVASRFSAYVKGDRLRIRHETARVFENAKDILEAERSNPQYVVKTGDFVAMNEASGKYFTLAPPACSGRVQSRKIYGREALSKTS